MGGIFVNLNPDLVDSHYDFEESDESSDLVGLQIDERWLVLRFHSLTRHILSR